MLGIYLRTQSALYTPDKGVVKATSMGLKSGMEIPGVFGNALFSVIEAVRLDSGLELALGSFPNPGIGLPSGSMDTWIFNRSGGFQNPKPVPDLVLLSNGEKYEAGWVYDRSDWTEKPYGDILSAFR